MNTPLLCLQINFAPLKQFRSNIDNFVKPLMSTSTHDVTMDEDKSSRDKEPEDNTGNPKIPPKTKKICTRSSTDVFLVGKPLDRIGGSQLPTGRQMFRYYIHLKNVVRNNKQSVIIDDLAYEVIDVVLTFWNMARIKTSTRHYAMGKFKKMIEKHRNLAKSKDRKEDTNGLRKKFEKELDSLFDIGAEDAIEEIKTNRLLDEESKKEDIAFYEDQRTVRQAHMSGHDKIFKTKVLNKMEREMKQTKRMRKQEDESSASTSCQQYDNADMEIIDESERNDPTFIPHMQADRLQDEEIHLIFPRKIMEDEGICAAADRLGLSDNELTMIVTSVINAGGGDISSFTISRSTVRRRRMCNRLNVKETTVATFNTSCPEKCVVHWDGKGIKNSLGSDPGESQEHLAVLVTGVPHYEEGKLLNLFK